MNAILTIRPYRYNGMWVFDDPAVGLLHEPFVSGVPEMIDQFVRDIPNAERGFKLLFSGGPFPGAHATLEWLREDMDGNWYRWPERNMEGWLCPALFKYFEEAPRRIYIRVEAIEQPRTTITVTRAQVELLLELLDEGKVESARDMVAAALAM